MQESSWSEIGGARAAQLARGYGDRGEVLALDLGTPDAPAQPDAIEACLAALARGEATALDLSGAPAEQHPRFADVVILARALRRRVLLRCTPAALAPPAAWTLVERLADEGVTVLAALPWGPHDAADEPLVGASLEGLRRLAEAGYAAGHDEAPRLDLVAWRPGASEDGGALERAWRQALEGRGLRFDRLHLAQVVPVTPAQGVAAHLAALVRAVPAAAVLGPSGR